MTSRRCNVLAGIIVIVTAVILLVSNCHVFMHRNYMAQLDRADAAQVMQLTQK